MDSSDTWPTLKTARDLAAEKILPCSEDSVRALAKRHGVGRKLGRTYVFTPDDVAALIEALPRPSEHGRPSQTYAERSPEEALRRALELASKRGSSRKFKARPQA
jgi:hypothetical protein